MIHQTKGIVLSHIKYAETSIIVHIYTELFGRQSYLVNGVRSSKSKGKTVLMQPLSILDMQVYHNPKKDLQRIKEFKTFVPFVSVPFEQMKRSIAFFITEVMSKCFREEVSNPEMFDYIENAIIEFDKTKDVGHFHLTFLAGLTKYLGFYPDLTNEEQNLYFDQQNGYLTMIEPIHPHFVKGDLKDEWIRMFHSAANSLTIYNCNATIRDELIHALIDYYRLHLHEFSRVKSYDVLRDLYHSQGN